MERSHVVVCLRGGLRGSGYGAVALHVVARAAIRFRQRVHQRLIDNLFLRRGLRRCGRGTAGSNRHGGRERGVTRGLSYRCRSAQPFALKTLVRFQGGLTCNQSALTAIVVLLNHTPRNKTVSVDACRVVATKKYVLAYSVFGLQLENPFF